jgi:signal transduction histidine kinase
VTKRLQTFLFWKEYSMRVLRKMSWLFYSMIYIVTPFLVIKYINTSREITFGVVQIISEIGVLLVLLYYRDSVKKIFSRREINLIIVCFVSAIGADFLYMNNLTELNKENIIMAFIQEIFIEDFLFMVFMTTMLIFLFKRMKEAFLNNKISIIFAILAGSIYLIISIKFALSSHFSPVIKNPDYMQFYSCMIISFIESIKVGLVSAMSARSNKLNDFLFLQAILLLCFSELGISYTELIVVEHLYGTSPFEAGWFLGIMVFFVLVVKEKGMPQFRKEDFTDNYSLRTIMSISILVGLTLFYYLLRYLKVISVSGVENVLAVILVCFLVWFFANLFSMLYSKILVNINLQVIKPNHFLLLNSSHTENELLNIYRDIPSKGIYETQKIISNYNLLAHEANKMFQNFCKQTKSVAFSKIAKKVSHDIRSPLSALSILVKHHLQELPEEKRIMIRQQIDRMQDIANDLSAKSRYPAIDDMTKIIRVELLTSILEEIISEKRLNFCTNNRLVIEDDIYDENSYGLFAKINLSEFKCIISNLINNALEALAKEEGKIVVKLRSPSKSIVYISIEDNGKGIPSEMISKLGFEGVSFAKEKNKESGNGLGLFHARITLEDWGGTLTINSEVNIGTKVMIHLPRVAEPKWFVPKIQIVSKQTVVILDDEQGIHQVWDRRFKEFQFLDHSISVIHLFNPDAFRVWSKNNSTIMNEILCLCDFEFHGYKESGLDLLEEYKLKNLILVTSHYENEKIRDSCENLGVRLIPKMLVAFVPLEVSSVI